MEVVVAVMMSIAERETVIMSAFKQRNSTKGDRLEGYRDGRLISLWLSCSPKRRCGRWSSAEGTHSSVEEGDVDITYGCLKVETPINVWVTVLSSNTGISKDLDIKVCHAAVHFQRLLYTSPGKPISQKSHKSNIA